MQRTIISAFLRIVGGVTLLGGITLSVQSAPMQSSHPSAPHDDTPTPTATVMATSTPASAALYCPPPPSALRILPMGDSLTAGVDSDAGSYRGYLWNKLQARGIAFNYVGGNHSHGPLGPPGDQDGHEGYPGFYTYQLSELVEFGMNSLQPNVVLLLAGTNDVLSDETPHSDNVQSYNTLMEKILTKWPRVNLVVAKIPRNNVPNKFNIMVPLNQDIESLAAQRVAQGHKVFVVDMYSVLGPEDIFDFLHPNESGYQKMSEVWLKGVCAVAASLSPVTPTPTASPTPTITPTPTTGPVFMALVLNNVVIASDITATVTITPSIIGTPAPTPTVTPTLRANN